MTSDSAGNFLVCWRGTFDPPESPEGPSAAAGLPVRTAAVRLYDIGGFPVSNQFAVNAFTTDNKFNPRASLTDDGSFVVAWTSGVDYDYDVKARKTAVRAAPRIEMDLNEPLSSPAGGSGIGNGIFEPGETQILRTAWVNDSAADVNSVSGGAPLFTGPPGAVYTLNDDTALYDTIPAGQTKSCIVSGDCYSVTVSDPAVRPIQHWDALLQETLNLSLPHTWVLHMGESFPDVPIGHQFYCVHRDSLPQRVTTGCAGGGYCPGNPVTRAQMAVFLLKSKFGEAHIPPPCTGTVFTDVPCTGDPFDPWIEELAASRSPVAAALTPTAPATPSPASRWRSSCSRPSKARPTIPPTAQGLRRRHVHARHGLPRLDRGALQPRHHRRLLHGAARVLPDQPEQPRPDGGVPRQDVRARALRRVNP